MSTIIPKHFSLAFLVACLISQWSAFSSCNTPVPSPRPETGSTADLDTVELSNLLAENPAFRLNQQGDSVRSLDDYVSAIVLYQMSMDSAAAYGDSTAYYDSKLDLACVRDRLNDFDKAIELGENTLAALFNSGDSVRIGRAYSTLSTFYAHAKMPEEELEAAKKGFEILRNRGSLIERCAAYNQMAMTFNSKGHWAASLPLLDSALLLMEKSGILDQVSAMYLNIGNCHRNLGDFETAHRYLNKAEVEAKKRGEKFIYSKVLERRSQVAEAEGNMKDALAYYKASAMLKDSIFTNAKMAQIEALEISFQTKEKEQTILLLEARRKAEILWRNMLLIVLGFVAFIALALVQRWRSKLKSSHKELTQHQESLHEFGQLLLSKNAQITKLENELRLVKHPDKDLQNGGDHPHEEQEKISLFNHNILTEEDWAFFKQQFTRGYPGFMIRLRKKFPEITGADERLILLIKMNFNTQEIASTLGISKDSVKKGRQRLRKRMKLERDEELEHFIQLI